MKLRRESAATLEAPAFFQFLLQVKNLGLFWFVGHTHDAFECRWHLFFFQRFTFPLDSQIASTARWEKSSAWAKLSYVRNEIRFSHSWIIFSAFYYSERIMKLAVSMCACCSYDVSAKLVRWCWPRTGHNRCIMLLANSIYRRVSKSVGQRAHRANRVWFSSVDVFLLSKSERANKNKAFWKFHRESCSFSRLSDKAAHVLHVVCVVFVRKFEMWGRKKFIYFLMFSVFLVTTTAKF